EFRDIVDGNVVGDCGPVAEQRRRALAPDVAGNELVDPDVHECRRTKDDVGHAAAADRVLDVPFQAKDVDRQVLRHAAERDVEQPAHAAVPHGGAQVLVAGEIDFHRARRPAAHVVVGGGNHLADTAAGLGQLREVEEIDGGNLGSSRGQRLQPAAVSRQRAHGYAAGEQLSRERAAQLTARTG